MLSLGISTSFSLAVASSSLDAALLGVLSVMASYAPDFFMAF